MAITPKEPMTYINCSVPAHLRDSVNKIAAATKRKQNEIVAIALEEFVKRNKSHIED